MRGRAGSAAEMASGGVGNNGLSALGNGKAASASSQTRMDRLAD